MILRQRIIFIFGLCLIGTFYSVASAPIVLPCGARIVWDSHAEYNINTIEVERLLKENAILCPYTLDITLWNQKDLDRALLQDGRAVLGSYTNNMLYTAKIIPTVSNIHHVILVYLPDEVIITETPGHDYSIVNTLSNIDQGNWVISHELGHMILWEKNLQYAGSEAELWCDHFANEHYEDYSLIERQ